MGELGRPKDDSGGTSLVIWGCIGSSLLLAYILLGALGFARVLHRESPILFLTICFALPVGFSINVVVALAASRARRRGCRSRPVTVVGWIAAWSLISALLLPGILGSLIEWVANRR